MSLQTIRNIKFYHSVYDHACSLLDELEDSFSKEEQEEFEEELVNIFQDENFKFRSQIMSAMADKNYEIKSINLILTIKKFLKGSDADLKASAILCLCHGGENAEIALRSHLMKTQDILATKLLKLVKNITY